MTSGRTTAVQLANAESIFPHLLARAWRQRGVDSVIVSATHPRRLPPEAGDSPIVDVSIDRHGAGRVLKRAARSIILPVSLMRARSRAAEFETRTGLAAPQAWETPLVPHLVNGWRVARAARALSPRVVFAHEVVAYGFAAARCHGIPRVLFPWGADVMSTAEVSRWHFRLVRYALGAADLIVPSSETGARHICARFGVSPDRVRAISWGVDLERCRRAAPAERRLTCEAWGIPTDADIVMNVRRFLPLYNCEAAVAAFLEVAQRRPRAHFVLLGGLDTDPWVDAAVARVEQAGSNLRQRFTFIRSNISMNDCVALMNVADVAVSLCGRGDMRSKSVLEAAAGGGALVLSDTEEYRGMAQQGLAACLVAPADSAAVALHVADLLDSPGIRDRVRDQNRRFLAIHEDSERQMDRLLDAVLSVAGPALR